MVTHLSQVRLGSNLHSREGPRDFRNDPFDHGHGVQQWTPDPICFGKYEESDEMCKRCDSAIKGRCAPASGKSLKLFEADHELADMMRQLVG